jgi:hypothetical protein
MAVFFFFPASATVVGNCQRLDNIIFPSLVHSDPIPPALALYPRGGTFVLVNLSILKRAVLRTGARCTKFKENGGTEEVRQ